MPSFNSKLHLSADDLPRDPESLIEGIRRIAKSSVLPFTENPLTRHLELRSSEANLLNLLITKHIVTGRPYKASHNGDAVLSKLRKKMRMDGKDLPHKGDVIGPATKKWFRQLSDAMEALNEESDIAKILKFSPDKFQISKLPKSVAGLQDLTIELMMALRGNIEDIDFPGIITDHRKIILGSLLARAGGFVPADRVLLALGTPHGPSTSTNSLEVTIHYMNAEMRSSGVSISLKRFLGYCLDEASLGNLTPYVKMREPSRPDVAVALAQGFKKHHL